MSLIINRVCAAPPRGSVVVNIYYSIVVSPLPHLVYYAKLNRGNEYDPVVDEDDFRRIYRSCTFVSVGTIEYGETFYRLVRVDIHERLFKNISYIVALTPYEIISLRTVGKNAVSAHFTALVENNPAMYTLEDDDGNIMLNPWVLYKSVDKKHIAFIEMYGFMREFVDGMPYFALDYTPDYGSSTSTHTPTPTPTPIPQSNTVWVRIVAFMNDITLNSPLISRCDIRADKVFIASPDDCAFFGY